MAEFLFSEADGTTLETIDSKWAGDSTGLHTNTGKLRPTAAYVIRSARYENSHGAYQSSKVTMKALTTPVVQENVYAMAQMTGDYTTGYAAKAGSGNVVELRRSNAYVTEAGVTAGSFTTDFDLEITVTDAGGGSAYIKIFVNGVEKLSYTDASPLTGGYPGFMMSAGDNGVAACEMYSWTDSVASGPAITDVNTDEALSPGETATITGTGFGATQGAGGVKLTQEAGALESALTGITWGGDTSITGTVALGGLSYGATTSLVVTDNAAATGSIAVTFVPATGYSYVTLSGYPGTGYVVGEDASPAVVDGDQVEYESTASSGATVTVNADGTFVLSTTDPASFSYRVRDNTDNTWSSWGTIRVNMPSQGGAGINLGIRIGV